MKVSLSVRNWKSGVAALLVLATGSILLPAGCSPGENTLGEKNPYYIRGKQLRQQSRYDDAAEAFHKCLRLAPGTAMAHLQLAMLYEDHLGNLPRAVVHYTRFIQLEPSGENTELARQWRVRAEKAYLAELAARYPEAVAHLAPTPPPAPPEPESRRGLTQRERNLARHLKRVNRELQRLRSAYASRKESPGTKSGGARPAAASVSKSTAGEVRTSGSTHTVRRGDTLIKISQQYYGSGNYWPELLDRNADVLDGSDRLQPGMKLKIPPKRILTQSQISSP